jgi:hypothetical protein
MKAIEVMQDSPTLTEILDLASEENIILRTPEGRRYVLAEIDDFAEEIEAVRRNASLMRLLDDRSKEPAVLTLGQVREQLQKKKRRSRTGRKAKRI